jgi:molybdate transport system substrate-binding protein
MKKLKWSGVVMALVLSQGAMAAEVLAAVAANFTDAANEIGQKFQAKTGHVVKFTFGSSGKFAAQIENGAPFEVLLAADAEHPVAMEEKGLGVRGTRFVYAIGRLVLWSPTPGYVDARGEVLKKNEFSKLAIANPKSAPYGLAAVEMMQKRGLWETLAPKLVQGENISQAFQFVETGNAQLGFVALSQVLAIEEPKRGSWWVVPADLHSPIDQQAILLTRGANHGAAKAFLDYLKSDEARAIIKRYGYGA